MVGPIGFQHAQLRFRGLPLLNIAEIGVGKGFVGGRHTSASVSSTGFIT
jgi:hypothetical protein